MSFLTGMSHYIATKRRATWEQQAIKRLEEPEDMPGAILFLQAMMPPL